MIKCEINRTINKITCSGTPIELTADCLILIRHLYEGLATKIGVEIAEIFRKSLVEQLTNPDSTFFLPIDGDNAEDDGNES